VLTLIALVLALLFLPSPWGWIVVIAAAVIDVIETAGFVWWSRRRRRLTRPAVGVEDLVGRTGVAATALAPEGQVRVHGEIWAARSVSPVQRGSPIVVRSVDGLVLEVEPCAPPVAEGA
jgi:membrane-bound serine protease (ClpP class)